MSEYILQDILFALNKTICSNTVSESLFCLEVSAMAAFEKSLSTGADDASIAFSSKSV